MEIVNYIERQNIPVRLYNNYVDLEFKDILSAKEYLCQESYGKAYNNLEESEEKWK